MASPTSPQHSTVPIRSGTGDDAIPDEDSSETAKLFHERLQAWKHACAYLEDYIQATEKLENSTSKEYEKVLKTINSPLKEGHHFEQQQGGVAGMFDSLRSNTQGLSNSHSETAKVLKGSVLPIFERLHNEVKSKTKELEKGAGKASKNVDKARSASQKHIELLGQHTSAARGSGVKAADDPYLIQRQVYHRLHKQVIEENNSRDDTIAVQNEFSRFETHVLQTLQQGLQQFNEVMAKQSEATRNMYGDVTATAQRIPPDYEWQGFIKRNNHIMVDPNGPKRSIENLSFANQNHPSTQPLIAGSLERKGKLLKKYDAAYYVITPSKYLHEFKSDDDFAKDPTPENSLYLPDCLIGAVDGDRFNVKGKDQSKGALSKMSMSSEFQFKAHTPGDAKKWHDVIYSVAGGNSDSTPNSPMTGNTSTMSPVSPTSTHTTGSTGSHTTGTPATSTMDSMHGEKDLAGNQVMHSERDASVPGSTTGHTESGKGNDYAPL